MVIIHQNNLEKSTLLKISVRVCPSFWYQMALSRVLAHGLQGSELLTSTVSRLGPTNAILDDREWLETNWTELEGNNVPDRWLCMRCSEVWSWTEHCCRYSVNKAFVTDLSFSLKVNSIAKHHWFVFWKLCTKTNFRILHNVRLFLI